ncbi:hypothetical protein P175DRAFT_0408518, partial [Aspergillus ochraceoroseus IBT 24754]
KNLKKDFIYPSLSLATSSILFINKPRDSLCLYINYQELNIILVKDYYLLLLIKETL